MKKAIGHSNFKFNGWIMSKSGDLLLWFVPVWLLWIVFFSNSDYFQSIDLPIWGWVIFILGFDVSHVWSTIFRTYLEKDEFKSHKKVLIIAPILVFSISIILLNISVLMFWRVMAYIAVFHFIKQQYGFLMLYKFKAKENYKQLISDKFIIYFATLYPIVFWHFNSQSNINWFVENDFIKMTLVYDNPGLQDTIFFYCNVLYWLVIGLYFILELKAFKTQQVSIPKLLWVMTTAVNWWFAIVYFNSDLIFSITNVVAHGLPYISLVYFYKMKKEHIVTQQPVKLKTRFKFLGILLLTIISIAMVEEYLWDMLVYRDHSEFFDSILPYSFEQLTSHWTLILVIALLALPQQTHYLIDGFIWKFNAKNKHIKQIFSDQHES
jgi:hypothetical protein